MRAIAMMMMMTMVAGKEGKQEKLEQNFHFSLSSLK